MSLTPKQKEVLQFIAFFEAQNGFAPAQSQIAEKFGFSSLGTVQNYLVRLEREGFLTKTWNGKRSLKLVRRELPAVTLPPPHSLPLLGRVAAGQPIDAVESDQSQFVEVPPSLIGRGGEHYALKVVGDSMVDDGILDGDLIVVKSQKTANNGEMVIALLEDAATVKRYFKKGKQIELHPANDKYSPIVVLPEADFELQGVVMGVIRKYGN